MTADPEAQAMSGTRNETAASHPLVIALVAGEESGDALGAPLMRELRKQAAPREISFVGVGGEAMQAEGMRSLFALSDIAVMGFTAVIARLPLLLRRIRETADALEAARPDMLVIEVEAVAAAADAAGLFLVGVKRDRRS